jgi:hypothetical protein
MTWPKRYGGGERAFDRYVVTRSCEPRRRLHFTADRQSGPILLRYASERIKADILPRITRGECCFCIGMSEPGSGSDLFAAATRATRCDGGWRVTGTKVWTTAAHRADYMIGLFRTSPRTRDDRRHGLTQFLVDMRTPGITVSSISDMTGRREFDEVAFDDALIPDDHVLGAVDLAWKQATSELALRAQRPERFPRDRVPAVSSWSACSAQPRRARRRGARPAGRAAPRAAPDVGLGRRDAAGRSRREPVPGGSIVKDLGTARGGGTLPPGLRPRVQRRSGGRSPVFDALLDYATPRRAQAHDPGRDHGDPARHHRPRPGAAMTPNH